MEKIRSWGLSVDVLINNAGFNEAGCFTNTNLAKELDMIQIHIKALTGAAQTLFAEKANINNTLLFKLFVMQPEAVAAIG